MNLSTCVYEAALSEPQLEVGAIEMRDFTTVFCRP